MTHSRTPQPFVIAEVLDYEDGRDATRKLSVKRADVRVELEQQIGARIDAETAYRKGRAHARVNCKSDTVADRKEEIDAATADLWNAKEKAQMAVDITKEKLEEIDGTRASLHRLLEWSMRLDPLAAQHSADARQVRAA